jgi:hypothetical protein
MADAPENTEDKTGRPVEKGDTVSFVHAGEHVVMVVEDIVVDPATRLAAAAGKVPATIVTPFVRVVKKARKGAR